MKREEIEMKLVFEVNLNIYKWEFLSQVFFVPLENDELNIRSNIFNVNMRVLVQKKGHV